MLHLLHAWFVVLLPCCATGDHLKLGRPTSTGGAPTVAAVQLPIGLDNAQLRTPCGAAAGTFPAMQVSLAGCKSPTMFYGADEAQQNYMFAVVAPGAALDFR